MQKDVALNPTEVKICFSHITLLEWNVKNCFVKLIQTLKINKNIIVKLNILIKIFNKKQVENTITRC